MNAWDVHSGLSSGLLLFVGRCCQILQPGWASCCVPARLKDWLSRGHGGWLVSQQTPSQTVPQRGRVLLVASEQQAEEGMHSTWVCSGLHPKSHLWWLWALPFLLVLPRCAALLAPPWHGASYTSGLLALRPSPRPRWCEPQNVVEGQMPDREQSRGDNQLDVPAL